MKDKIIEYVLKNYKYRINNIDLNKIIYRRIDDYLVDEKIITEEERVNLLKEVTGYKHDKVSYLDFCDNTIRKVSKEWIEYYQVIPFNETKKSVYLLCSDPFNVYLISLVEQIYNKKAELFIDEQSEINHDITLLLSKSIGSKKSIDDLIDSILSAAYKNKVSDIHFDVSPTIIRVCFRIDGLLKQFMTLNKETYLQIINKIKLFANMDITVSYYPLDGHFKYQKGKLNLDIRVSTIPSIDGERLVLRFLNTYQSILSIDDLGFTNNQLTNIKSSVKGGGIVFLTGPTGSGKTTTLYALIEYLKNRNINIMTIEDPIEKRIEDITQIPLNMMDYPTILKSIVRQDPDVIMIGEIRDDETANMAIKLAQTGHLILATIHSKDSISVIERLNNWGINRYQIIDTIKLVISQRLIRKICPICQNKQIPCKKCMNSGFYGRVLVGEVIKFDDILKDMLFNNKSKLEINKYLKNELLEEVCKYLEENNYITHEELVINGLTE